MKRNIWQTLSFLGLLFLLVGCGDASQGAIHSSPGAIHEFSLPAARSHPLALITGPDGNLWFTEANGNKIGFLTIRK